MDLPSVATIVMDDRDGSIRSPHVEEPKSGFPKPSGPACLLARPDAIGRTRMGQPAIQNGPERPP